MSRTQWWWYLMHAFIYLSGLLDEYLRKYGSLIPVQTDDIVEELQGIFNEDFSQTHRSHSSTTSNTLFFVQFFVFVHLLCITQIFKRKVKVFFFSLPCAYRKAVVQHLIQSYQRSSGTAMLKGFRVNYKRHVLTMDDLSTLYGQNWLNDQVSFELYMIHFIIQSFSVLLNAHIVISSDFFKIMNMYGDLVMDSVPEKVNILFLFLLWNSFFLYSSVVFTCVQCFFFFFLYLIPSHLLLGALLQQFLL